MYRNLTLVKNLFRPHEAPTITQPQLEEGAEIEKLIKCCHPLEDNSTYAYFLLCKHFAKTCAVAKRGDKIVGFISAYLKPDNHDTLFIWQVAVLPDARGHGLALKMIENLLQRHDLQHLRYVEATVTASNKASKNLFISVANEFGTSCKVKIEFSKELFDEDHEDEYLFRIGPLNLKEIDNEFSDIQLPRIRSTVLRPFVSDSIFES